MLAEALLQEIPPGLLSTFPVERLQTVNKALARPPTPPSPLGLC